MMQRVNVNIAVIASKIIIALSALIGSVALVLLAVSVQDQREFNHCLSNLDSKWRHAVGIGLVEVSENDDEGLRRQAAIIRELSQEEC